jgi:Uma2 family endonuclease
MTAARVVLNYRDYAALPNDGRRYEIHEGELSVTPAPSPKHQIVSANLVRALDTHVRSRRLGLVLYAPLDIILSDTTVVQPDIVFVATERAGQISERGIEGAPTLVIEILSPSTTETDRHTKLQLYARYRIRTAGDTSLQIEPFSDLRLSPASLWG